MAAVWSNKVTHYQDKKLKKRWRIKNLHHLEVDDFQFSQSINSQLTFSTHSHSNPQRSC